MEVFREPVGRADNRKLVGGAEDVERGAEGADGRVGAVLGMQRIRDRRLGRLVMLRPRTVGELARDEQARDTLGEHDERAQPRLGRAVDRVVRRVADPALTVPRDADA